MQKQVNLWLYADELSIGHTSASLIIFGLENLKSSYLINNLEILKKIKDSLESNRVNEYDIRVTEFSFNYLVDCIKILIFFENYMKAELINNGFCVHKIKKDLENYKDLHKKQFNEPITLDDINGIEKFDIDTENKLITHRAISDMTIGFKELVGSTSYKKYYQFDDELLDFVKELNIYRNKLHFHNSIEFSISDNFIKNIEKVNQFADLTLTRIRS